MQLAEALTIVDDGEAVTSDSLPLGAVLKREKHGWDWSEVRVVFVETGAGHSFTARPEHRNAEWYKVEGWLSYGI